MARLLKSEDYRLIGDCQAQLDRVLAKSLSRFGTEAFDRYTNLLVQSMRDIALQPNLSGSESIGKKGDLAAARAYPIRFSKNKLPSGQRVANPRHVLVYRVAADGIVDILGIAHDSMLLERAAKRMLARATKPGLP